VPPGRISAAAWSACRPFLRISRSGPGPSAATRPQPYGHHHRGPAGHGTAPDYRHDHIPSRPHRMGRLLNALKAGLGRPETRHRHHAPQEHVHLAIGQRRLLPAAAGDDDKGLWYVHIPPHCAPKQSYLCWRRMIIAVLSNVQPVYRFPVMGYCVSAKSISVGRCIGSLA